MKKVGSDMRKIIRMTACALCIALLLPGCSGGNSGNSNTMINGSSQSPSTSASSSGSSGAQQSSSSGQEQQMIKPEQLISKDEAKTLLGEAVKDGADGEYPLLGLNLCFYAAEKKDSKSYLQIAIIQQSALQQGGGNSGSEQSGQPSQSSQQSQSSQPSQSSGGGGGGVSLKDYYEGFKKMFSDPNAALTGRIGDDAFLSAQGVSILVGEYYIFISAATADPAKLDAALKQAAEMVVNNLKRIMGE